MINQNSNIFSIRNSRNGSVKIDLLGAFGLKSVRLSLVQLRAQINKKTQIDGWGYLISFARKITLCPLFCLKYSPFSPQPVPAREECTLDWNVHSSGPYTLRSDASATWQVEIIFTHWQLSLSGLQSAKKCFTQMARERETKKRSERERDRRLD